MRGRHLERACATDDEHRDEQQIPAQRFGEQRCRDHDGGQRVNAVRRAHNRSAVIAICRVADQEREHHRRYELNQSHKAKIERAVGEFVDLPADRQSQHLITHGRGEPRQPEEGKGPLFDEARR